MDRTIKPGKQTADPTALADNNLAEKATARPQTCGRADMH